MDGQGLLYILDLLGTVMQQQSLTIQQLQQELQRAQQIPPEQADLKPDPPSSPNGVPEQRTKVN